MEKKIKIAPPQKSGIDIHKYIAQGGDPKKFVSTSGSRQGTFTNNKSK